MPPPPPPNKTDSGSLNSVARVIPGPPAPCKTLQYNTVALSNAVAKPAGEWIRILRVSLPKPDLSFLQVGLKTTVPETTLLPSLIIGSSLGL